MKCCNPYGHFGKKYELINSPVHLSVYVHILNTFNYTKAIYIRVYSKICKAAVVKIVNMPKLFIQV